MSHTHQEPASEKTYLYTENGVDHYARTEDEARYLLAYQYYRCSLERCRACGGDSGIAHVGRNMYCTMIPVYRLQKIYKCNHEGEQHPMLFWNCDDCKRSVGLQHDPLYEYMVGGI